MEDPRRIRRAASAAGLVLALLTTALRPAAAAPSAKLLRVLVAADEEPEMFSFEPGSAPGLEREMIESFARLHGRRLEVVPVTNFEQIIPTLRAGQGDVILGMVDTEARRELVAFTEELLPTRHVVATLASRGSIQSLEQAFTEELLPTRHVVATLASRGSIQSLEQLRMQRVGVVTGSSWAEAAAQARVPANRTVPFVDSRNMVQALLSGQIAAVVMEISSLALVQKKHPELRASLFLGPPGRHAWAVRKDDTTLRDQLNEHIRMLKGSGTWGHLLGRYLGPESMALLASARRP